MRAVFFPLLFLFARAALGATNAPVTDYVDDGFDPMLFGMLLVMFFLMLFRRITGAVKA